MPPTCPRSAAAPGETIDLITNDAIWATNETIEKLHELSDHLTVRDRKLACLIRNLAWNQLDLVNAALEALSDREI